MSAVPDEYLCPITLLIMRDPVMGGDGRTYERSAITQWLQTNPNSPLTRQPMTISSLKPNYALKSAIERFQAAPAPKPTTAPKPAPKPKAAAPRFAQHVAPNATTYEPIPQLIPAPPPVPSAPPPDDVYYAIQVYQHDLHAQLLASAPQQQQQVRYGATTQADPEMRRKKLLSACACLAIIIVVIIIISRVNASMNS